MLHDPVQLALRFRDILDAQGAAGWMAIGRALEDPDVFEACRTRRLQLASGGLHHQVAAIVPLNEALAEHEVYRLDDPNLTPDIFFGLTYGFGRKSHADHALFYRAPPLIVRFAMFGRKDNGYELFTADGRLLVRDSSWLRVLSPSPLYPYLDPRHRFGVFALPTERVIINDPCLFIGGQTNHYHFIIDHLPLILLAERFEALARLPVVLHCFGPAQDALCRCFGVDPSRFILLDRHISDPIFTAALAAPILPAKPPLPLSIAILRQRLGLPCRGAPGRRRIFVGRRPAQEVAVRLVNQEAIAASLAAHGFETVFLESLSIMEQRSLFEDAEIVVAAHGAGLTNLVFAPSGTRVVEIMSDVCNRNNEDIFSCYRKIATIIGQPYYRLVCPSVSSTSTQMPQDLPFVCDPDRLMALIGTALDCGF